MSELHIEALAPFDIHGRDLGVLLVIDRFEPTSQQQVALRMGVDRTTMVAIIDALEAQGIIARHPDAEDRRRNVVELTPAGHDAPDVKRPPPALWRRLSCSLHSIPKRASNCETCWRGSSPTVQRRSDRGSAARRARTSSSRRSTRCTRCCFSREQHDASTRWCGCLAREAGAR